mmetsp:Transcript_27432/g.81701  ORF Transcript_27432/g.81701 Transcript_27432/m.81701 type:complete len:253 (-) Transcript_27432:1910-2668(-)
MPGPAAARPRQARPPDPRLLAEREDAGPGADLRAKAERAPLPAHRREDGRGHPRGEGPQVRGAAGPLPVHAPYHERGRCRPESHQRGPRHHGGPGVEPGLGCAGGRPSLPHRPGEGGARVPPHHQRAHRGQDVQAPGLQDGPPTDGAGGGPAAGHLQLQGDQGPLRVGGPGHGREQKAAAGQVRRSERGRHQGAGGGGWRPRRGLAGRLARGRRERLQRPLPGARAGGGVGGPGRRGGGRRGRGRQAAAQGG